MYTPISNSQALFGGIEVPERDVIDEIISLYVDFEEVPSGGFEVEGSEEMEMILGAFVNANEFSEIQSSLGCVVANTHHTDPDVAPNNAPTPAAPDTATRPLQQRNLNINSQRRFNFPAIKLKTQSKHKKENPEVKRQAHHSNPASNQRYAPPPSLYKMLSNGWR